MLKKTTTASLSVAVRLVCSFFQILCGSDRRSRFLSKTYDAVLLFDCGYLAQLNRAKLQSVAAGPKEKKLAVATFRAWIWWLRWSLEPLHLIHYLTNGCRSTYPTGPNPHGPMRIGLSIMSCRTDANPELTPLSQYFWENFHGSFRA